MLLLLLLACEETSTFDVYCGADEEAVMGHVSPARILNLSMCWEDEVLGDVCDMTPAPGTIIHTPGWGFVADCRRYGPDAWLRAHYLMTGI